jgi:hypothetical protein
VTGVGLKELAAFKNLGTLDLSATNVTGVGMRELAVLKNLTTLYLRGPGTHAAVPPAATQKPSLNDAGAKGIAALKSLTNLDLSLNNVTAASLKELERGSDPIARESFRILSKARLSNGSAHESANWLHRQLLKCLCDSLADRATGYRNAMAAARWPWNQDRPKRTASAASESRRPTARLNHRPKCRTVSTRPSPFTPNRSRIG